MLSSHLLLTLLSPGSPPVGLGDLGTLASGFQPLDISCEDPCLCYTLPTVSHINRPPSSQALCVSTASPPGLALCLPPPSLPWPCAATQPWVHAAPALWAAEHRWRTEQRSSLGPCGCLPPLPSRACSPLRHTGDVEANLDLLSDSAARRSACSGPSSYPSGGRCPSLPPPSLSPHFQPGYRSLDPCRHRSGGDPLPSQSSP